MTDILYQTKRMSVSKTLFKTPARTYKINNIEKITLKRPLFWFSIPLAVGSAILLNYYEPYLYDLEKITCLIFMSLVPLIFWFVGTLYVTSKSYTNDNAITGFMPLLKQARSALEHVIYSTEINPVQQENRNVR